MTFWITLLIGIPFGVVAYRLWYRPRHRYDPLGRWHCLCGWSGNEPSMTDASIEVYREGAWVTDRTHRALCPRCFREVINRE